MGFSMDISVPVLTVFLQGLLSFSRHVRTAAPAPLYWISVLRDRKARRGRTDYL